MKAKTQDLMHQHWDDVRVFLAVWRAGSLGKAALRLGLDTSTVSRRLTALEATLGAKLFDRRRDGLGVTELAESVVPAAEAMESALGLFARNASGTEAKAEGVVRISSSPGIVEALVAPSLVRLRAAHPGIRIELDASTRVLDLGKREADIALRSVRPEGANLVVKKVASAKWVCAASRAFVKKLGTATSWESLPWIAWDHDFGTFGPARWLAKHASKACVVLRTSHFGSQATACRSGLGVMLVPEPHTAAYGLVRVPLSRTLETSAAALPEDDLWMVTPRESRALPRIAVTWQFLLDELGSAGVHRS